MFEIIEDVPEAIKEFYQIETRQVQQFEDDGATPAMQIVDYTYPDEEGNEKTDSRMEPVFFPIDYVVPVSVGERKDIDDVWRIVHLHCGRRDELVRSFLSMACNDAQWQFHDEYVDWLIDEPHIDDEEYYYLDEEDVKHFNKAAFDEAVQFWQSREPQQPSKIDVDQWFLDNYEALREAAYPPREKQFEMQFDDLKNGTNTWFDAIEAVKKQYPKPPEPDVELAA